MNDDIHKLSRIIASWVKPPNRPICVTKVEEHDGITVAETKDGLVAIFGERTTKSLKEMI